MPQDSTDQDKFDAGCPNPYAQLRTGGFHSARRPESPSSTPPTPHPYTRSPSPSAQDLTHPPDNGLPQNALESVESPPKALVFFFAHLGKR